MSKKTVNLPRFDRVAQVRAESFDPEANTIEVVWTTGASVRRYDWWDGTEYDEVLDLSPKAVRLGRLNAGAPFLDTHCSYSLDAIIGSVVPDSAEIGAERGTATVLLSKAPGVADTVTKIREGVIRNVSVGYWVHKVIKTEGDDGTVARWNVVDWEPLEISAVPIPADPGSQIRSEQQKRGGKEPELRSCLLITKCSESARNSHPPKPGNSTLSTKTPKNPARSTERGSKTPAELEAERLAKGRGAKRDSDEDNKPKKGDDDEERDGDEDMDDEERDGTESDGKGGDGDGTDDERGDGGDDDEDEKSDKDGKSDDEDGKRSGRGARKTLTAAEVRKAAEAAVRADRKRATEIREIGSRFGLPKMAEKHAGEETSVRAFKDLVLERLAQRQAKRGSTTFAPNSDEDVTRTTGQRSQGSSRREIEEGTTHWGRVAGKPPKSA